MSNNYDGPILIDDGIGTPAVPGSYFGFGRAAGGSQSTGPRILAGAGDPNGVLVAPIASLWLDTVGGLLYQNSNGGNAWTMGGGGSSISGTLLGSFTTVGTDADYDFQNIPQTHDDLLAIATLRGDDAAAGYDVSSELNGNAGAVYYVQLVQGEAGALSGAAGVSLTTMGIVGTGSADATRFAYNHYYIQDYTVAGLQKIQFCQRWDGRVNTFGTYAVRLNPTQISDPIDRVRFFPQAGNFVTGSSIYLIGLDRPT